MPCRTLTVAKQKSQTIADEWHELWLLSPEKFPSLSPMWHSVWERQFATDKTGVWTAYCDENELVLIAPLTIDESVATFACTTDLTDYNDFLTLPNSKTKAETLNALIHHLKNDCAVKTLNLQSVPDTSDTAPVLAELAENNGWSISIKQEAVSPFKLLPDSWDEYLQSLSRKNRHELRRKLRRVNAAGEIRLLSLTKPEDIDANLNTFFDLHRSSTPQKRAYMTPQREQFFRNLALQLAQHNITKLNLLQLNGTPIATSLSFISGNTNFLYNSGYNPEHAHLAAGLANHALSIQLAISVGIAKFDFMRGDEKYKYDLGAIDRHLLNIEVRLN